MGRRSKLEEWNAMEAVLISDARYLEMSAWLKKEIEKEGVEGVINSPRKNQLLHKLLEIGRDYVLKVLPVRVEANLKNQVDHAHHINVYMPGEIESRSYDELVRKCMEASPRSTGAIPCEPGV